MNSGAGKTRLLGTLVAGVALLVATFVLISRESAPSSADRAAQLTVSRAKSPSAREGKNPRMPHRPLLEDLPDLRPPVESPNLAGSPANQDWIATRTGELDKLAWFDDAESLGHILSELRNSLPEIRAAALSATLAFGSRDAVPYLEAIAADSKDPIEQKALTDVAERLKLPTVLEHLEEESKQNSAPPPVR